MRAVLEGIRIKNFKSIKDAKIKLNNVNVLVGPNGSGKTNLVDAFLLLKRIYGDHEKNPFSYWWGYPNVVFGNREDDSVSMEVDFKITAGNKEFPASFRTEFSGTGGEFVFLEEVLDIEKVMVIKRSGNRLRVREDDSVREEFEKRAGKWTTRIEKKLKKKKVQGQLDELMDFVSIFFEDGRAEKQETNNRSARRIFNIEEGTLLDVKYAFLPLDFFAKMFSEELANSFDDLSFRDLRSGRIAGGIAPHIDGKSVPQFAIDYLRRLLGGGIVLKINTFRMKEPQQIDNARTLYIDGSNTSPILHAFFLENGQLPKSIKNVLSHVFPTLDVRLQLTSDHRIHIKAMQNGSNLVAPSLPDGLYKVIAILTALELKPPLLVIDELENSIHPETMNYILDEFELEQDMLSLITTHSPSVVDMTPLEDLLISEMTGGRTIFRRIKNPEEAKSNLKRLGLTFSEGWLHGDL